MTKNIIKETLAKVVSNSKVLSDFCNNPQPWGEYASRLIERSSPGYEEEVKSQEKEQECYCSNCMYCLGLSWRDFM